MNKNKKKRPFSFHAPVALVPKRRDLKIDGSSKKDVTRNRGRSVKQVLAKMISSSRGSSAAAEDEN